ncbi:hypothetical protein SAMN05444374_10748 [Rhodococcoides kroppenstedtii]|uniref:Uncharacterized protein n=1 Tax=Rhodococcoides kroppenstedtii TaxID=293050 RepID=A0A1I0TJD5_9NOCA|nr:hypothetical protein SAMN05444374_10748 [Rhodococcus kroppenstedtii]
MYAERLRRFSDSSLRMSAKKHVTEALPRVGELVQKYA